ncbi:MAG: CocE/NonD family hydrolase [Acidimicrobiales bacterium]
MRRAVLVVVLSLVVAVGATACDPAKKVEAAGGTFQIRVRTAPNAEVALFDRYGNQVPMLELGATGDPVRVNTRHTDEHGNLVIRYVPTGYGYVVKRVDSTETAPSDPVTVGVVLSKPKSTLYTSQTLNTSGDGYGYLKTRDGTLLSYTVRLPGPVDKGPYPTIVEYSGYDPSNPYEWSSTAPSSRIANLNGYAVVGVNIRGTGCSGGSFFLWEDAQATDGYDVVETVAAQPWVKGHKVGMAGLSYPGNAALYAASTQPPSLAAIAVGGTYDDGFRNLLRPSGIVNSGFAKSWIKGREDEAEPSGQAYTRKRIADGDIVCELNQWMRTQNVDLTQRIEQNPYFPTMLNLGNRFAPSTVVNRIKVPVLLIATWQDEQVGGHVPTMTQRFTGSPDARFIFTNGGHAEMFAVPDILQRWGEFLDLYVAKKVPNGATLKAIAPYVGQQVLDSPSPLTTLPFPADRFTGKTYAQALSAYQAEPKVRVVFENGGGADGIDAGLPHPAFAKDFATYPIPGTSVQRWYFGEGGTLTDVAPTAADDAGGTIDSYVSDASVRPRTSTSGGGDWAQIPQWNWAQPVAGKSLSYLSPALTETETMIGSGSVDLWLRSSAADTDLQVSLTEVRPDGKEQLIQSGWMRASVRKLDTARSTELQPLVTMLESDASPLPAGEFTPVRVEIYPFAHVFRPGSQIRLIITAPGGDRIAWAFDTLSGTPTNEIARSIGRPSSVALPIVSGVTPTAALPACPGSRGEACRTYQAPAG